MGVEFKVVAIKDFAQSPTYTMVEITIKHKYINIHKSSS